ncbi:MAG: flagellar protein export ATPase FliI [Burkholderiales bacterium]|nr:flagellar protein export ATPase FliI [Burkholderiales bacterium]
MSPRNVPRPSEPLERWAAYLGDCRSFVLAAAPLAATGRLTHVSGLVMQAEGLRLPVGSACVVSQDGAAVAEAEVVGFSGERLFLMPTTDVQGLRPGARVIPVDVNQAPPVYGRANHPWRRAEDRAKHLPVGFGLLGRVLDGAGLPLDRRGPLAYSQRAPLAARPMNPVERAPIERALDVGVRAINALATVGRGQRMGLFAGSGVGKSVLLGMMARGTAADVNVVALVGERGREVKEFVDDILGEEGLARSVVVAAPADAAPLMRVQAAAYACAIAEFFRDQGKDVLFMMDSLTRYAMAQREIALAVGEPPATKGYPPSVFARLPQLVERAGNGPLARGGSITAFYTVLAEGDDPNDPIADAARAVLDGHVVLSRELAEQGHFPAIEVEASVSRVMPAIVPPARLEAARSFRRLYARYRRSRDLFAVGAYVPGGDPVLDRAVALWPAMERFLQQDMRELADLESSATALEALLAAPSEAGGA